LNEHIWTFKYNGDRMPYPEHPAFCHVNAAE
jgi:hypothetical protein